MFGKLMKHDMRSMMKVFLPLWGALLAVSGIYRAYKELQKLVNVKSIFSIFSLETLMIIIYVALIFAVAVVAMTLIIQRFYNGLLKDEGYLMFTLPVKTWQLIASKLLIAIIVTVISFFAGVISVMILAMTKSAWQGLPEFISEFYETVKSYTFSIIIPACFAILFNISAVIVRIYAAMSIGHLAKTHRIICSVAAYIGFNVVENFVLGFLPLLAVSNIDQLAEKPEFIVYAVLISGIAQTVLFFFVSELILSKKLNLE